MGWLVGGSLVLTLPGAWALRRAERELEARGRLGPRTVLLAFAAYGGHASITLLAALRGSLPLAVDRLVAGSVGVVLLAAGGMLYLAGRSELGSFRRTWGLDCSRLVTAGVYRYSRHPQTLGALLVLTGAALAGRSGSALVLAGLLVPAAALWLPIEERFLERRFGEAYRRYRSRTPRFAGRPRGSARE